MTPPVEAEHAAADRGCHSEAHTGACSWTAPSRAEESRRRRSTVSLSLLPLLLLPPSPQPPAPAVFTLSPRRLATVSLSLLPLLLPASSPQPLPLLLPSPLPLPLLSTQDSALSTLVSAAPAVVTLPPCHFVTLSLLAPIAAAPPHRAASPATRPSANLVPNGKFDRADASGRLPAGWTTKHADNVKRVSAGGPRGWVVEMTGDEDLMGAYGTDLVSPRIPVKANTRYRCTGFTKSGGPNMIVFVKGYATLTRRVNGRQGTAEDVVYQIRKEIGPSADWQAFNLDFQIRPTGEFSPFQHRIEYLRITLWAYWPEGTCWYDDIRFEEVGPVPPEGRLHGQAVTHTGIRPRLAETQQAASRPAGPHDEQIWLDAINAWQEERCEDALKLSLQLIAHDPGRADCRLLAARAAAKLGRWSDADRYARSLLDESAVPARNIEPWHKDWARIVHADVLLHTNQRDEARHILENVRDSATSPHARAAARQLLEER
jgi:hypothetical protein